jgi:hypothetical protein
MLSERELIHEFKGRGIFQGGELYLDAVTALEFLDTAPKNDMTVIGIEGFHRDNGSVRPLLDQIADFSDCEAESWPEFRESCNHSSKEFISQAPKSGNLVINLTLMTKDEWKNIKRLSQ